MSRFTNSLLRFAALFFFIGLAVGTARADDFYAAPGATGTGLSAASPDELCDVVALANANAAVDTIYLLVPQNGGVETFFEDLVSTDGCPIMDEGFPVDVIFDTFEEDTLTEGISGTVAIDGDVTLGTDATIEIVENLELQFVANATFTLNDDAEVVGDGVLSFPTDTQEAVIFLGDIDDPNTPPGGPITGSIENLVIDVGLTGSVMVVDQGGTDNIESILISTNSINVVSGSLVFQDNELWTTADDATTGGPDPGINISGQGQIEGEQGAVLFLVVSEAANGPGDGFPNSDEGCFEITGAGFLNMSFDKVTDGGVCIELSEVGTGGTSFNRAGALFVTDATVLNGNFTNDGAARTEFWALTSLTDNLEVVGPGGEVDDTGTTATFGTCGLADVIGAGDATIGENDANESGVYFFSGVTIEGPVELTDSDDPATPCVEGVWFLGDDPADGAGKALTHQPRSVFTSNFTATGLTGVFLASGPDFVHNLELQGDINFDESPFFVLEDPALDLTIGDLCAADYACGDADGNKVIFGGGANQTLEYNTELVIASVQIAKNASGQIVEIDEDSDVFLIDTSLEIIRGEFITNGLLDANAGVAAVDGATIVINRDASGLGILLDGTGDRAYVGDDEEFTPRKIKYCGSERQFTGAEIPGTTGGSLVDEVRLYELEIFASDPNAVITLGKDITVVSEIQLVQGILDVGSSELRLENEVLIAIGDGKAADPAQIGFRGNIEFPNEPTHPFSGSFTTSEDGIDLLFFGRLDRLGESDTDLTVGLFWPPAETSVVGRETNAEVVRDVRIDPICGDDITVRLRGEDDTYQINGDLTIGAGENGQGGASGSDVGTLDIAGNQLNINAVNGFDSVVEVHNDADLTDSTDPFLNPESSARQALAAARAQMDAFVLSQRTAAAEGAMVPSEELHQALAAYRTIEASKTLAHAGEIVFTGTDDTAVWIETSTGRLRFDFPAIEVDRNEGHVTFDAEGIPSTITNPEIGPNRIDILGTSHFTLVDADLEPGADTADGDRESGAGGVELLAGLDLLDIFLDYTQFDGEFEMAGVSSTTAVLPVVQTVSVGGNFNEEDGEFFSRGGDVRVFGNFNLGENEAQDASDALFSLSTGGVLSVAGNFTVAADTNPDDRNVDADASGAIVFDRFDRNCFFLGDGQLDLFGDYTFLGTGDNFDDDVFLLEEQGLQGKVNFLGNAQQNFTMRQDEDAFLNDVEMAGEGGIQLLTDGWQNDTGTLLLRLGIIDTNDEQFDWIILNPGFEPDLVGTNNSDVGKGVVQLGSRDSYINGEVQRVVQFGNSTGGLITGGYLFPVGTEGDTRFDGPAGDREVDFFRPLILQFPNDLGRSSVARVDYLTPDEANVQYDATTPLVVDDVGDSMLTLDVIGNMFWKLEFDRIPSFDPNIRVEAASLPNVFDIKKLRLVMWNCDGTNPRLAGLYDVDRDPTDDASAVLNDYIDGIPNLTQEGVRVSTCNIIGIASDGNINRIDIPDVPGGFAKVQLIHNSPDAGAVDVYADGRRVANDMTFRTATPFINIPAQATVVEVVAGTDVDNSNPVLATTLPVARNIAYAVAISGTVAGKAAQFQVKQNVRLEASSPTQTEFFTMHGAPALGEIDIRTLDPNNNNTPNGIIANNINFGDVGNYNFLVPGGYNIEVISADLSQQFEVFRFDFNSFGGETFVFLTSGEGTSANCVANPTEDGFCLIGFDVDGNLILPSVVTSTDTPGTLPTEFVLDGNYPNPFNPSTNISFDLPATAKVSVEIVDVLGRRVMTVPVQVMEAGAKRTIEVNASTLASGTYIYRLIAETATDTMIKTGRMTLVK